MLNDIGWSLTWFFLGMIFMLIFCAWKTGTGPVLAQHKKNEAIIERCEKDLTRKQSCVLVAVPSKTNDFK